MTTDHMHDFASHYQHLIDLVESALSDYFAPTDTEITPLNPAIRYALLGGGKRMRATLTLAFTDSYGQDLSYGMTSAMAIECIHAYSLVHDDLPDMDDDDLRRGKPTTHKAFDNATAILVGDALQSEAFKIIADATQLSNSQKVRAFQSLSLAAGKDGMVGGQQLDINLNVHQLAELEHMHQLKTGALIRCACELGAISADADDATVQLAGNFGQSLGLMFQITDDLLDVKGTTASLGKTQGKDRLAGKTTYVSLLGLEGAQQTLDQLTQETKNLLKQLDSRYNIAFLEWLVDLIYHRES